ncbi:MAG: hypothetical protein ACRDZT_03005 [Acidimicrobiales bacterium]
MKEPYTEGAAIHGDPESCVVIREDAGEALTGARAGRAIEPRNQRNRGAQAVNYVEGNIGRGATRESRQDPARSENHGMYGTSMRENREVPLSPAPLITGRAAQGRPRPQA